MKLKIVALFFLNATLFHASAFAFAKYTFDVDDYQAGSLSSALYGANMQSYYHSVGTNTILYGSPSLQLNKCGNGGSPNCEERLSLGSTFNLDSQFFYLELGYPLDSVSAFYGIEVSFEQRIDKFWLEGFSDSGDNLLVFLFDRDGNLLKYEGVNSFWKSPGCQYGEEFCHLYDYSTLVGGLDVHRIAFGSSDSAAYINKIAYSVYGPSLFSLTIVGLIIFAFINLLQRTEINGKIRRYFV